MRPVLNAHPDELERLEKSHSVMDAGELPRLSVEIKSKRYLGEACFTKKNLDMTVPIKSTEFRLSDYPSEDHSIPPYKGFIASEDRQLNLPIKSISQKKSIIALTEHKRPKVVSQAHINSAISMAQLPQPPKTRRNENFNDYLHMRANSHAILEKTKQDSSAVFPNELRFSKQRNLAGKKVDPTQMENLATLRQKQSKFSLFRNPTAMSLEPDESQYGDILFGRHDRRKFDQKPKTLALSPLHPIKKTQNAKIHSSAQLSYNLSAVDLSSLVKASTNQQSQPQLNDLQRLKFQRAETQLDNLEIAASCPDKDLDSEQITSQVKQYSQLIQEITGSPENSYNNFCNKDFLKLIARVGEGMNRLSISIKGDYIQNQQKLIEENQSLEQKLQESQRMVLQLDSKIQDLSHEVRPPHHKLQNKIELYFEDKLAMEQAIQECYERLNTHTYSNLLQDLEQMDRIGSITTTTAKINVDTSLADKSLLRADKVNDFHKSLNNNQQSDAYAIQMTTAKQVCQRLIKQREFVDVGVNATEDVTESLKKEMLGLRDQLAAIADQKLQHDQLVGSFERTIQDLRDRIQVMKAKINDREIELSTQQVNIDDYVTKLDEELRLQDDLYYRLSVLKEQSITLEQKRKLELFDYYRIKNTRLEKIQYDLTRKKFRSAGSQCAIISWSGENAAKTKEMALKLEKDAKEYKQQQLLSQKIANSKMISQVRADIKTQIPSETEIRNQPELQKPQELASPSPTKKSSDINKTPQKTCSSLKSKKKPEPANQSRISSKQAEPAKNQPVAKPKKRIEKSSPRVEVEKAKKITKEAEAENAKKISKEVDVEKSKKIPNEADVEKSKKISKEADLEKSKKIPKEVEVEKSKKIPKEVEVEKSKKILKEVEVEKSKKIPKEVEVDKSKKIPQKKKIRTESQSSDSRKSSNDSRAGSSHQIKEKKFLSQQKATKNSVADLKGQETIKELVDLEEKSQQEHGEEQAASSIEPVQLKDVQSEHKAVVGEAELEAQNAEAELEAIHGEAELEAIDSQAELNSVDSEAQLESEDGEAELESVDGEAELESVVSEAELEAEVGEAEFDDHQNNSAYINDAKSNLSHNSQSDSQKSFVNTQWLDYTYIEQPKHLKEEIKKLDELPESNLSEPHQDTILAQDLHHIQKKIDSELEPKENDSMPQSTQVKKIDRDSKQTIKDSLELSEQLQDADSSQKSRQSSADGRSLQVIDPSQLKEDLSVFRKEETDHKLRTVTKLRESVDLKQKTERSQQQDFIEVEILDEQEAEILKELIEQKKSTSTEKQNMKEELAIKKEDKSLTASNQDPKEKIQKPSGQPGEEPVEIDEDHSQNTNLKIDRTKQLMDQLAQLRQEREMRASNFDQQVKQFTEYSQDKEVQSDISPIKGQQRPIKDKASVGSRVQEGSAKNLSKSSKTLEQTRPPGQVAQEGSQDKKNSSTTKTKFLQPSLIISRNESEASQQAITPFDNASETQAFVKQDAKFLSDVLVHSPEIPGQTLIDEEAKLFFPQDKASSLHQNSQKDEIEAEDFGTLVNKGKFYVKKANAHAEHVDTHVVIEDQKQDELLCEQSPHREEKLSQNVVPDRSETLSFKHSLSHHPENKIRMLNSNDQAEKLFLDKKVSPSFKQTPVQEFKTSRQQQLSQPIQDYSETPLVLPATRLKSDSARQKINTVQQQSEAATPDQSSQFRLSLTEMYMDSKMVFEQKTSEAKATNQTFSQMRANHQTTQKMGKGYLGALSQHRSHNEQRTLNHQSLSSQETLNLEDTNQEEIEQSHQKAEIEESHQKAEIISRSTSRKDFSELQIRQEPAESKFGMIVGKGLQQPTIQSKKMLQQLDSSAGLEQIIDIKRLQTRYQPMVSLEKYLEILNKAYSDDQITNQRQQELRKAWQNLENSDAKLAQLLMGQRIRLLDEKPQIAMQTTGSQTQNANEHLQLLQQPKLQSMSIGTQQYAPSRQDQQHQVNEQMILRSVDLHQNYHKAFSKVNLDDSTPKEDSNQFVSQKQEVNSCSDKFIRGINAVQVPNLSAREQKVQASFGKNEDLVAVSKESMQIQEKKSNQPQSSPGMENEKNQDIRSKLSSSRRKVVEKSVLSGKQEGKREGRQSVDDDKSISSNDSNAPRDMSQIYLPAGLPQNKAE